MSRRFSINDIELPRNLMKDLSTPTLKALNKQDEATFYEFFEGLTLEDVNRAKVKIQQIRDANKEIAVKNVELEPRFNAMKAELLERTSELNLLKEEYDKKLLELKAIQSKMNYQTIEKELAQATRKIEQESDDYAANFTSGKSSLSLEDFQEKFQEERTLYWLRKVKLEKMKELLQNYRPIPAPRTSHSTPPIFPTPTPPYPTASSPLPPQHQSPGYPVGQPAASLPPYPATNRAMPSPHHQPKGFPAAAYTPFPSSVPPRPAPYSGNRVNQHRY